MKIKSFLSPPSLYFRLVSLISITAIVAFLIFRMIMIYSVEQHFAEQDAYDLKKIAASFNNILSSKNENIGDLKEIARRHALEQGNKFIYLENQSGEVIFKSADDPNFDSIISGLKSSPDINKKSSFIISSAIFSTESPSTQRSSPENLLTETAEHMASQGDKKSNYRTIFSPINGYLNSEPVVYTLIITMPTDFHFHYISQLKSTLAIAALFICILIILLVLISVYQGHAPLRQVSRKIASITSENLNSRLQPDAVPIELRQLVVSFNTMIERIEDVFKRQANFSGDIAHEMRTPITNLVTQTQFMLNQKRSAEEYQELLYSNLEEYERMAKMVGDMLFLSQADNQQLVTNKVAIDLKEQVIKVFEYFEALAEEKGVFLHLQGEAAVIQGDPAMLRRVVNNLLSNAIRYTSSGETITVSLFADENSACLSVSNPGKPIPAEHLAHLFDRFYRVDQSRQRKGDGSGIGLAIVRSIVEAHQGRVSVTSDPQLTSFTIYLPLK